MDWIILGLFGAVPIIGIVILICRVDDVYFDFIEEVGKGLIERNKIKGKNHGRVIR